MKQVKVKVDKRIELLGVLLRLSNYGEKVPQMVFDFEGYPYLNEVKERFAKFKNHQAVKTLNEILQTRNFIWDAPVILFLYLDDKYDFYGQKQYPFVDRLEKSEKVLKFLKEVKVFAKDCDFDKFFEEHQKFYDQQVKRFESEVDVKNVLPWMKNFFNSDFDDKEFNINLSMLLSGGGFGGQTGAAVNCTEMLPKSDKNVGFYGQNDPVTASHFLHEFCHAIINPLTAKHLKEIDDPHFSQRQWDAFKQIAYTNTETIINEAIIRGLQILYVRDNGGDEEKRLRRDEACAFDRKIILSVAAKLDEFRQNPDRNFEKSFVDIANVIAKTVNQNIETE